MKSNLQRFLNAQENAYESAVRELRSGKKSTHWMWFMFPQIRGLGRSEMAKKFEITDAEEATEFLQHKILGKRLIGLTKILVGDIHGKSAGEIFGFPDRLKFHSSMTLFYLTVENNTDKFADKDFSVFQKALEKYYNGETDGNKVALYREL